MIVEDKTITTIFIVPTLGIDKPILNENGFINGYLDDFNYDIDYEDVIYLLFKPKNLNAFKIFLEGIYENNKLIIEDYNSEKDEIIIIFKLNEKFKEDYDLILAGKYSETSEEFKDNFPKTVIINGKETKSLQAMIFDKDPKLARYWSKFLGDDTVIDDSLELWPVINLNKEILNYEENDK